MTTTSSRRGFSAAPFGYARSIGKGVLLPVLLVFLTTAFHEARGQTPIKTVVLNFTTEKNQAEPGNLARELARQAILIAARDECGLSTRDAVLRESPEEAGDPSFLRLDCSVRPVSTHELKIKITRRNDQKQELSLGEYELKHADGATVAELTAQCERLSREDFVAILEQAGCSRKQAQPGAKDEIPAEVAPLLGELSALTQFAAIRALHAEIRKSGDSRTLLSELARAYALLGSLTELQWSPAHKVFKARALLYAERLHAKAADPIALSTRAYVRALAGLHQGALDDLAALTKQPEAKAASPGRIEETRVLETYCRGDSDALAKEDSDEVRRLHVPYLQLLLAEATGIHELRVRAATELLKIDPDCMRAMDSLLDGAPLGIERTYSSAAFGSFSGSLYEEVRRIGDLPEKCKELALEPPEDPEQEIPRRVDLMDALRDAGRPEKDNREPSLTVASVLIQETGFIHAWKLMSVQRFKLYVNGDETLELVLPIVEGHPYESFLRAHAWDQKIATAQLKAVANILRRDPHVEATADPVLRALQLYKFEVEDTISDRMLEHGDVVFRDLLDGAKRARTGDDRKRYAERLREVSPYWPATIVATIANAWDQAAVRAVDWEEAFAREPSVQSALATRYLNDDKPDAAERCLKRRIEVLPDQESYKQLAGIYRKRGDDASWVKTLEDSLEVESYGLEHAQTHVQLARHFMQRHDTENGLSHADEAAESWAAWAMLCAMECHEQVGQWKEAEQYARITSERYENSQTEWYFWCRRTGHGDANAARRLAEEETARGEASKNTESQGRAAVFHYLEGRKEKALEIFQEIAGKTSNDYYALQAALLADEMGETELRDKSIEQSLQFARRKRSLFAAIIHDFRGALRAESPIPFDVKQSEVLLTRGRPGDVTNWRFFIGKFLLLRGRKEEAVPFLQQAAASPKYGYFVCPMAGLLLSEHGIPREPLHAEEFEGDAGRALELVKKSHEFTPKSNNGKVCLKAIEDALAIDPNSLEAMYSRAWTFQQMKRLPEALADYDFCLERLPRCTHLLYARGGCHEAAGDFAAAIRDYERVMEIDPDYGAAYHNLAFVLAACSDAQVRNGKRAVELARRSLDIDQDTPEWNRHGALAAALAEAGEYKEAAEHQEQGLKDAPKDLVVGLQARLELYRAGKPFHRDPK